MLLRNKSITVSDYLIFNNMMEKNEGSLCRRLLPSILSHNHAFPPNLTYKIT